MDHIYQAPPFLQRINQGYSAKAGNIFLLHGNTIDLFPGPGRDWKPLLPFLLDDFSKENRIFVHIDLSGGLKILPVWPSEISDLGERDKHDHTELAEKEEHERLSSLREQHRQEQVKYIRSLINFHADSNLWESLERESVTSSFAALLLGRAIFEALEQGPGKSRKRIIFVINDLSAFAPAQSEGHLPESDRRNIQLMHKWFNMSEFLNSRHVILMIAQNIEAVHQKVKDLPQVAQIKIPRPNTEVRSLFVSEYLDKNNLKLGADVTQEKIADSTAGLTIRDIEQLMRETQFKDSGTLELSSVSIKTKDMLDATLGGYIQFFDLTEGLDTVLGQKKLKPHLIRLAKVFKKGSKLAVPNGILISGPNGGGKSFIIKRFLKETGWLVGTWKNFRNMYYGETERIFGLIEEIATAVERLVILIDEGDTEIGGRGPNVHDVDKRIFGRILRMMEKNKGKICWIIITARPDKLEPDIKRSGRAGHHFPVFAPDTSELQEFIDQALLAKVGLSLTDFTPSELETLLGLTAEYYPADYELLLEQLCLLKESEEVKKIGPQEVLREARELAPSELGSQRQLQIYTAIAECTDRRLIPQKYQELARDKNLLQRKIIEFKVQLGEL